MYSLLLKDFFYSFRKRQSRLLQTTFINIFSLLFREKAEDSHENIKFYILRKIKVKNKMSSAVIFVWRFMGLNFIFIETLSQIHKSELELSSCRSSNEYHDHSQLSICQSQSFPKLLIFQSKLLEPEK